MQHLIIFIILVVIGTLVGFRFLFRSTPEKNDKGIERGKARADRNPNPMNAVPQVMLDRAAGKIADACAECGRPSHRPHTTDCKSRGVKIIKDRSGRQKGERI